MINNIPKMIEGYAEIKQSISNNRKYGVDLTKDKAPWKEIVNRLHPYRITLKVADITDITGTSKSIRLVPLDGYLPPFQAGQYINLFVEVNGIRTGRPYSISSSPAQKAYYEITVKRKAGGFVSAYLLDQVNVGDILESTGPAGHFHYNPLYQGKRLVFLAGGSGITPFMSMIREVTDRSLNRNIHLIYGCRSPEDVPFLDELKYRAEKFSNFTFDIVISDPADGWDGLTGLIDADLIKKIIGDIDGSTFYICGPSQMYDFCIPELQKLNIPRRRLRQEIAAGAVDITADPAWPTKIKANACFSIKYGDKVIPAKAKESILVAFERTGIALENCCRAGECSLCRVKLISGNVFQASTALVRKSDRKAGYIHACASYPLSDLEIMQ